MKNAGVIVLICAVISLFTRNCARAQGYLNATGSPAFSTQLPFNDGFVNVNNGEIHIEIPLAQQTERGNLQLNERLVYDSRIWQIVANGGYSWQATNVPNSMGGWRFSSGTQAGTYSYATTPYQATCEPGSGSPQPVGTYNQYNFFMWTDSAGTAHAFPDASTLYYSPGTLPKSCGNYVGPSSELPNGASYANDGSGYYMVISNYNSAVIFDQYGNTYFPTLVGITPTANTAQVSDSNGNYWSQDSSGNLIDTLGRTPVKVTTSGNQTYYDVLGINGITNRYTVTMQATSYSTAFKEQAVAEAAGSFSTIQSIQLPDKSSYSFTYDSGTSSGSYGELTSMTLPTGGTISFAYINFLDSFQNQNRWLNTLSKDGGQIRFTPATISNCTSSVGCQERTTVTSPSGDDTVYTFTLDKGSLKNASSWKTGEDIYQGSSVSGGTKLVSSTSAYSYATGYYTAFENGQNVSVGTYQTPSTLTTVMTLPDVGEATQTITSFGYYGAVPTDIKKWDFYASSSAPPTNPTIETVYGYTSPNGIMPSSVASKDGAGNLIAQTTYAYDETTGAGHAALAQTSGLANHGTAADRRFNLTTTTNWLNTGGTLTSEATYNDAGAKLSSTEPNGTTTTGYDSTDAFATSLVPPTPSSGVSLQNVATYDVSTGLPLTNTDPNGQVTTYKSYDEFNRVGEIDYPDGGRKLFTYTSPNNDYVQTPLNTGTTGYTYHDTDAYGRADRIATFNGQSANQWYQRDSCFDTSGRLQFKTYMYQGTGLNGTKVCSGGGDTYSYDGLNRVTTISHADGTKISYTFRGRATRVVDENGVGRITQVDGLGRITSVCEISSVTLQVGSTTDKTPVTCKQDIAATGFLTTYTYAVANHSTAITQGAQTRTTVTDSLGRTVSITEPERGITTYSYAYNGTGLVVTRKRPKANQATASVMTTTTTQYDSLGRVVSVSYDDGLTPTKQYFYDAPTWAEASSQQHLKGQLSLAQVVSGGTVLAGTLYSYDPMARITETWQCTPSGCGNAAYDRAMTFSYDWQGNLISQCDPDAGNITYGRSPADEITSITNNTYTLSGSLGTATLLSTAANGPNGPISYSLGNGLSQYNNFDGLGRINGAWVCIGAPSYACPNQRFGFYLNWSGARVFQSGENYIGEGLNYQYDDFNRLSGMTNSSGQPMYSYVYDRYGNRWQQNALQGGSSFSQSFNAANNQVSSGGYQYDAAGNMTYDPTNSHHYTYDAEGSILQADSGSTGIYVYDALNHRVQDKIGSQVNEYLFEPSGRVTSNWLAPLTPAEGHVFADGMQIAFRSGDGRFYFNHKDWLGTDRVHTDLNGATAAIYTSLPFGDGSTVTDSEAPYAGWDFQRFGDIDYNWETNTYHAQFRNYSQAQGRWLSPDPYDGSYDLSNPQSFNRYAYVLNNPLAFTDPTGQGVCLPVLDPADLAVCTAEIGGTVCGPVCAAAGAGIGAFIGSLKWIFGWGAPQFHGSLQSRPNSPSKDCPPLPQHPDWGENFDKDVDMLISQDPLSRLITFKQEVETGGPMDYKDLVPGMNDAWSDFGNFRYGYIGYAAGIREQVLLRGGGAANWYDNPATRGQYGAPFGSSPYGDQPQDQAMIKSGIDAAKKGCHY